MPSLAPRRFAEKSLNPFVWFGSPKKQWRIMYDDLLTLIDHKSCFFVGAGVKLHWAET